MRRGLRGGSGVAGGRRARPLRQLAPGLGRGGGRMRLPDGRRRMRGDQRRRLLREHQLDRAGGGSLGDMFAGDGDREADVNDDGHPQGDQIGPARHRQFPYGPDCVLSANFVTPSPLMTSTTCMTSP